LRSIVKYFLLTILIFAGVASGVYVGQSLSNKVDNSEITPESIVNESYFELGDRFPDYDLRTAGIDSSHTLISDLVSRGPLLIIFASPHCDACEKFSAELNHKIVKSLDPDIQLIQIYDVEQSQYIVKINEIERSVVFFTNRRQQITTDGIYVTPTLVALDQNQNIKIVMTGFNRLINAELINEYIR
jgi:thioredoxin-related protein